MTAIRDHYPHVELDAFIVMPNHVHMIVVLTDSRVVLRFSRIAIGPARVRRWNRKRQSPRSPGQWPSMFSFTTRAGIPTTWAWAGTSRVTTAPAPTTACAPIVIWSRTIAPMPM